MIAALFRRRGAASGLICALVLAACAPAPVVEKPDTAPQRPARSLKDAAHYRVVDAGTRIYARVYRGGSMAKLGHNHVVLFPGVRGDIFLAEEPGDSLFDLTVPVADAVVDPPALRQRQGRAFQSELSDDARARTRRNMLGEDVLDAARHPYIQLSSAAIHRSLDTPRVTLDVRLKGVTRQLTVPVFLSYDEAILVVEGELDLRQSDFGIEPFAVLGGALRVRDRVELVFEITAERVDPA